MFHTDFHKDTQLRDFKGTSPLKMCVIQRVEDKKKKKKNKKKRKRRRERRRTKSKKTKTLNFVKTLNCATRKELVLSRCVLSNGPMARRRRRRRRRKKKKTKKQKKKKKKKS